MASRTAIVTPRGRAVFPHLNTPDTKFDAEGAYHTKLAIPSALAEELTKQIDAAHAEAMAQALKENPKLKKVKEASLPYALNPDDENETVFKFKMNAAIKGKDGSRVTLKPSLFDSKGKMLDQSVRIGGGSTIKVSFEPKAYYTAALGAGVTLRLKAVQVIDLKSFSGGGTADSYGFAAESDGFTAEDAPSTPAPDESTKEAPAAAGDGSDF